MMKIAVVENEAEQSALLEGYIRRYAREHGEDISVNVFGSGLDFVSDYTNDYDLVFMDIHMPMMDGLHASERLRRTDGEVRIVFVTNLACHAIDGYKVGAMDFLVKPVGYYDVALELGKVARIKKSDDEYVWLGGGGSIRKVPVSDIRYIGMDGHNVAISLRGGGEVRVRGSLKDFEERLAGKGFSRCDHCALVNLRYVQSVSGDEITLEGGDRLFVSRRRRKGFNEELMRYIASGRSMAFGAGV